MELGERLKVLFKDKNLTNKEIGVKTGVSEKSVNNYFSSKNLPNDIFFNSLRRIFPKLNFHWLFTGEGSMFDHSPDSITIPKKEVKSIYNSDDWSELKNLLIQRYEVELKGLRREVEQDKEIMNLQKDKIEYLTKELKRLKEMD